MVIDFSRQGMNGDDTVSGTGGLLLPSIPAPLDDCWLAAVAVPPNRDEARTNRSFIDDNLTVAARARALCEPGLLHLPLPGGGATLARWQTLASVAHEDLCVAKIVEAHADALAILDELGGDARHGLWGVFAAEPPTHRTIATQASGSSWLLNGRKAWCSGAWLLDHALITASDTEGNSRLFAIDLDDRGVARSDAAWAAVGMSRTRTCELRLHDVEARAVGSAGDYVTRPGFWHGAMGIAACWYGGMVGLADALLAGCRGRASAHALAHLGACDAWIHGAASLLAQAAGRIDRDPSASSQALAMSVRAHVESAATAVAERVGRALGATPYCVDAAFAMRSADLTVFIRQSHAEADLETLGRLCLATAPEWRLA